MPATFTEILPPTKSSPHAAIDWTPGAFPGTGTLTVTQKRAVVEYVVTEFPTGWDGRAFRLVKAAGSPGTDAESESYNLFVARDGTAHECGCKGFVFGRGKPCKHVLAALALIENRWV